MGDWKNSASFLDFSLVSTIEELLGRKSSSFSLEI
jgi:hypothetical protein